MPWKTSTMISQRAEFILQAKSPECSHRALCKEFGISRTTGYKWLARFEIEGREGLRDRSRRPKSSASAVPHEITIRIVAYRRAHPSWGATKIRKILQREFRKVPSRRTIHRVLQDCNFITTRRAPTARRAPSRTVVKALHCNHIWTVDFKGWWKTKDGKKVFPLTIRDEYSRFVLAVVMLPSPSLDPVKEVFRRCFERYGMPMFIRSDNGSPFAFSQGLCGLSRLSAWWLKLGIVPNFIPPASPQYNARHERMHRDMAADLETSPARNLKQQQMLADSWKEDYNCVRPHDALNDRTPSEIYKRSKKRYSLSEPALEYPSRMFTRYVNRQGSFKYEGQKVFLSKAFGQENIGLELTTNGTFRLWFAHVPVAAWTPEQDPAVSEFNLITGELIATKKAA